MAYTILNTWDITQRGSAWEARSYVTIDSETIEIVTSHTSSPTAEMIAAKIDLDVQRQALAKTLAGPQYEVLNDDGTTSYI